ncbi:hypothetical protein [Nannocystis punicea]|uniref:Uncharacterized protein n=1 Tax=Nannocystis punicea TaxID=2995304 RepID=A0ABY7HFG6_9BACT|nr:hypothetical protein [Nannocystis poenicansa]WAS98016.1 hypothetical protein O0S08_17890 [Nannocystis poenicansa]
MSKPDSMQRLASRGVAAAAVMVLLGGAALLGLESCAQSGGSKPIQAAEPKPSQDPIADPAPEPKPEPEPQPEPDAPLPDRPQPVT